MSWRRTEQRAFRSGNAVKCRRSARARRGSFVVRVTRRRASGLPATRATRFYFTTETAPALTFKDTTRTYAELYGLEGMSVDSAGTMLYVADGTRGEDVPHNYVRTVKVQQ